MINTGRIVKVYLPQNLIGILNKDMTNFGIKNNGKKNVSKMCNLIFDNYSEAPKKSSIYLKQQFTEKILNNNIIDNLFKNKEDIEIKNLKNNLKNEFDKLVDTIYETHNNKYADYISFRLNIKNSIILEEIEKKLGPSITLSDYFRSIFNDYCHKPQYQREKMIFLENYLKINDAINNKYSVKFIINNGIVYSNNPYGIISNIDEQFNYIIGLDENRKKRVVRLSKISSVIEFKNKASNFTNEENILLNNIINRKDPFIERCTIIKLKLTNNGQQMYERITSNRPNYIEKNENIFTFNCSEDRVYIYFLKFGKEVEIIEPISLRERFKREYMEAFNIYNDR